MNPKPNSKFKHPEQKKPDFDDEITERINVSPNLSHDPAYTSLMEHYQSAEFDKCNEIIAELEKKYPNHTKLKELNDLIQMKASLKTIEVIDRKVKRHKKRKVTFKMSLFAIFGTLIVMAVFILSFLYLNQVITTQQLEKEASQLASLNEQAEQLLVVGKPQPVAEIIVKMKLINPEYENLPNLLTRTNELLLLETKYQNALDFVDQGNFHEAMTLLNEIESERPGLWDVSQQIAAIETSQQIAEYLKEANTAYQNEQWDQVIDAYENALKLDPNIDTALMKQQLFYTYLNKINKLVQQKDVSTDDIEQAENYYQKASAQFLQCEELANEKENLENVRNELLGLKYKLNVKVMLEDKHQTGPSVALAVSYLRKAADLEPNNSALQLDLENAESYQLAFQNFIELDWESAINNLILIRSNDKNYADGNATSLLYEAYHALGKQNFSVGLYQDALNNFKQAEILAREEKNNLMKLFQTQTMIGNTLGEMGEYENAAANYQSALSAIQIQTKLEEVPEIANSYTEAVNLASDEDFEGAFNTFRDLLENIHLIYTASEIEVRKGTCLALIASENLSTVDAIFKFNELPQKMVLDSAQTLLIPKIEKK